MIEHLPAVSVSGRIYAACIAAAEWCERRRATTLVAGASVMALILVAIARAVLQDFPNSGDEYVYLYQAATLAGGHLTNPQPPAPDFFQVFYVAHEHGRAFGTFPFGWPLLLSLAIRLHIPTWLVNPLLAVATLFVIYLLTRAFYGPRVGVLAAAVTAVSPLFLLNGASYFSHTFCGLLLLVAAYAATLAVRRQPAFALVAGFAIGWAVLTRYFTGAIVGIAIVAWMLQHGRARAPRLMVLLAVGGLPWMVLLALYNTALSGSPWTLTTIEETYSNWFAPGFLSRGPDILANNVLRLLLWTPPMLAPAYVYYLRRAPEAMRQGAVDWILVATAAMLLVYVNRGGNQYGPRFYYEAALFMIIFTTANLFAQRRFDAKPAREQLVFTLVAASVACLPFVFAFDLYRAHRIIEERRDPFLAAERASLTNAIVLIDGRVGTTWSMDPRDLVRNDAAYVNPVLFAIDRGAEDCELRATFPKRDLYVYRWDPPRRAGTLAPLRCPALPR